MRHTGRITGTGAVLAAVLLTACGGTGEDRKVRTEPATRPAAPAPATCTGPRADETAAPVEPAVAHVDALAAERFAHVYTGLSVDHEKAALDVWRIPDAAFDRAVCRGTPANVTVRLHPATAARTRLDALQEKITDDMGRWEGKFDLRTVAVAEEGHVEVGVDRPEVAAPLLRKAYGDLVEAVFEEQPRLDRG
ncbi:hypothetical protein [Streptomyces indicus]|uniref:Lipoprotein n=1 Tax=Streptomyces indicus TaxID=417292 RepID=A0A1G9JAZ6_9ACTN|nr:hypothetical protein [Streptomyces indicus]SDL34749.1 hypothetical protein SAMN05421806_12920 [Streptomyces indicus]